MEYLQTLHPSSLQEAFSLIDSKYEIPEDVNETALRTLRKDTEIHRDANIQNKHFGTARTKRLYYNSVRGDYCWKRHCVYQRQFYLHTSKRLFSTACMCGYPFEKN